MDSEARDTPLLAKRRGGPSAEPIKKISLDIDKAAPFFRKSPAPPAEAPQ
jgi:hypothetical protein